MIRRRCRGVHNVETGKAFHSHTPKQERFRREAALDETIEQSFPAIDSQSTVPNPDSDTENVLENA